MKEFFPHIKKISYEGPSSKNPLCYRYYNPDEQLEGKSMRDHLRFSIVYWHSMRGTGSDPFGAGTMLRPWDDGSPSIENAQRRAHALFEIASKLQLPFYAFHDRDVAPEGATIAESNKNLDSVVAVLKELQKSSGVQLLWGTACLFAHPRYVHGAATSCNLDVYAYAAAQVKKALEVTKELDGRGYVFWGGREGYSSLLNTDMKREIEHLAAFLHMCVDYKKKIKLDAPFYIEPKPKEPTTHQYDSDAAACLNFLRQYDLLPHFKLNIEANHATLAGHTFVHELETAAAAGALGSIDANTGDLLLGWDTDEFPYNIAETAMVMYTILKSGGFSTGGVNFDAKARRASFEPDDIFHAHILGVDTYARALRIAVAMRKDGELAKRITQRYRSWDGELGRSIERGQASLEVLEQHAIKAEAAGTLLENESGGQERLQTLLNGYL
jgi:xylose isomerase